jgi:hypothetical protein
MCSSLTNGRLVAYSCAQHPCRPLSHFPRGGDTHRLGVIPHLHSMTCFRKGRTIPYTGILLRMPAHNHLVSELHTSVRLWRREEVLGCGLPIDPTACAFGCIHSSFYHARTFLHSVKRVLLPSFPGVPHRISRWVGGIEGFRVFPQFDCVAIMGLVLCRYQWRVHLV